MISECNQALIRASEESELLTTVCGIVVEVGGYRMAWVGYREDEQSTRVRPVAHAGHQAGYLDRLNSPPADAGRDRCANDIAVRTGSAFLMQNIARCRTSPRTRVRRPGAPTPPNGTMLPCAPCRYATASGSSAP